MHLWSKMLYTIEICTIDPQTMKLLIFIFYFFRCLILRVNGELSQLDLVDGLERELTDSIELFWVTNGLSDEKSNLIEKVSWLDYGHKVMQVLTLSNRKISCRQSANKNQISLPMRAAKFSLLEKTSGLIKSFLEYFDMVVSVARKIDGRHWADLFSAAGRSIEYVISLLLY
ncbi:uncharacterized protein LOC131301726 isoform X2 [Rhododendron vialii]|uniref:uncharacterized protein LOC131301726 isoform X2 n=1 Tax=Rhododendron vialii TaxID=182163 RepID=UPI00265FEAF8|nr:uncharacterized protein LOC131301726 isoform X2 [Rhododendron vialii]